MRSKRKPIQLQLWNGDDETQTNTDATLGFASKLGLLLKLKPILCLFPIGRVITHDFLELVRKPAKAKTKCNPVTIYKNDLKTALANPVVSLFYFSLFRLWFGTKQLSKKSWLSQQLSKQHELHLSSSYSFWPVFVGLLYLFLFGKTFKLRVSESKHVLSSYQRKDSKNTSHYTFFILSLIS